MTSKIYFMKAQWLDREIAVKLEEEARLQEVQNGDPRAAALLNQIRAEKEKLFQQKEEVRRVIDALPTKKEQMVMRCRYLLGMKWEDIAAELDVDPRTARRWHDSALEHAVIQEK